MFKSAFVNQVEGLVNEIANSVYTYHTKSAEVTSYAHKQNILALIFVALIPSILTSVALATSFNAVTVAVLSFIGGIGTTLLTVFLNREKNHDVKEPAQEDLEQIRQKVSRLVNKLMNFVEKHEHDISEGYDVTLDRVFGKWVQRFLVYADSTEDRRLLRLRDDLVTLLGSMKIQVYDQLELDEEGKPAVPHTDYLLDNRSGEEYHEVKIPAIYSSRSLLAQGEIS